ncbi:CHAT domain-containing protein [Lactarius quietus]|nr:CHAT domain-containing protein [Lactarius quietus]
MMVLYRELLTCNIPADFPDYTFNFLDQELLDDVIELLRDAVKCPNLVRGQASSLLSQLAFLRSEIFQNPEYSEMAISRLRAELRSPDIDERLAFRITEALAFHTKERFKHYNLTESLEEANPIDATTGFLTGLDDVRETYSVTAIQQIIHQLEEELSNTPAGTKHHNDCLKELAHWHRTKFSRTNDISDIEESIKYCRLRLDATHPSHPKRELSLASLRNFLFLAFQHTNKRNYLDDARQNHFSIISSLVFGWTEDSYEAVRLMPLATQDQYAREPDRFRLSCLWAALARYLSHPSTLNAYESSMSLMQRSLPFAPTVSIQHARLVAMGENCQKMPLDYASYQIELGRFEEAVQTLEQGRALLWSEMRSLRTPMIIEEDSLLAKRFARDQSRTRSADHIGHTERKARNGRRPAEIGGGAGSTYFTNPRRPGLEGFLKTPSFSILCSAASHGPVILINHCRWRSDILIELVDARKRGLDSKEYQDTLSSVLKSLYELVGEPVIERLRALGVPQQSRIWWCPTSVFCSLPLHAMGPIPSNDTFQQYFSDIYIPSYTPSLFALVESRNLSRKTLEKPSLLLVAQPDDSLPGVWGEIEVAQGLNVRVTNLVSSAATPSSVVEGLRGSQFAHFACHGELETGKPFEASFKLHGGARLTLLDIVQSRLPDAEFALLSCCHTAEITEESIADETLHLTAAMQYCGFRSVVGTMWAMADTDGRDLAKSFYKSLFFGRQEDVPYYERSARALREATRKLRKKRGITLERWVNFVHYGA